MAVDLLGPGVFWGYLCIIFPACALDFWKPTFMSKTLAELINPDHSLENMFQQMHREPHIKF